MMQHDVRCCITTVEFFSNPASSIALRQHRNVNRAIVLYWDLIPTHQLYLSAVNSRASLLSLHNRRKEPLLAFQSERERPLCSYTSKALHVVKFEIIGLVLSWVLRLPIHTVCAEVSLFLRHSIFQHWQQHSPGPQLHLSEVLHPDRADTFDLSQCHRHCCEHRRRNTQNCHDTVPRYICLYCGNCIMYSVGVCSSALPLASCQGLLRVC